MVARKAGMQHCIDLAAPALETVNLTVWPKQTHRHPRARVVVAQRTMSQLLTKATLGSPLAPGRRLGLFLTCLKGHHMPSKTATQQRKQRQITKPQPRQEQPRNPTPPKEKIFRIAFKTNQEEEEQYTRTNTNIDIRRRNETESNEYKSHI